MSGFKIKESDDVVRDMTLSPLQTLVRLPRLLLKHLVELFCLWLLLLRRLKHIDTRLRACRTSYSPELLNGRLIGRNCTQIRIRIFGHLVMLHLVEVGHA